MGSSKPARKGSSGSLRKKTVVLPTRRSGRVTIDRVKAELLEAQQSGNAETIAAKEAELAEMIEKKNNSMTGNFDIASATQQPVSFGYERLDSAPYSMLNPSNESKILAKNEGVDNVNEACGMPILEMLRCSFAEMTVAVNSASEASLSPNRSSTKRRKLAHSPAKTHEPCATFVSSKYRLSCTADDYCTNYLDRLSLSEDDVAKVTEDRITCTHILPFSSKLVVISGDKKGYVGIWDVDNKGHGGDEGIYKYQPHVGNICNIHCNEHSLYDQRVYTSSYDGTIRSINLSNNSFDLMYEMSDDISDVALIDVNFSPYDDNIAFLGRSDGSATMIDQRMASGSSKAGSGAGTVWSLGFHDYKINSIQQHPTDENYVVTASSTKEGRVSIHDLRMLKKCTSGVVHPVVSINPHNYSINAANISPNGKNLVTVSQDSTIKVWQDFMKLTCEHENSKTKVTKADVPVVTPPHHSIRHDNTTGRWLSTFRPVFDLKMLDSSVFMVGSMEQPRKLDIFMISNNKNKSSDDDEFDVPTVTNKKLRSDYMNSVCSRNSFHPYENIVAGGNSSGRVHIFR